MMTFNMICALSIALLACFSSITINTVSGTEFYWNYYGYGTTMDLWIKMETRISQTQHYGTWQYVPDLEDIGGDGVTWTHYEVYIDEPGLDSGGTFNRYTLAVRGTGSYEYFTIWYAETEDGGSNQEYSPSDDYYGYTMECNEPTTGCCIFYINQYTDSETGNQISYDDCSESTSHSTGGDFYEQLDWDESPEPTSNPTIRPTEFPSDGPTNRPTETPTTKKPTSAPTEPSYPPTPSPTDPTKTPTSSPTPSPTNKPTVSPSGIPTETPTRVPSSEPTNVPTSMPSNIPSSAPSNEPSNDPTISPTKMPSSDPTRAPSNNPTKSPIQSVLLPNDVTEASTDDGDSGGSDVDPTQVGIVSGGDGDEDMLTAVADDMGMDPASFVIVVAAGIFLICVFCVATLIYWKRSQNKKAISRALQPKVAKIVINDSDGVGVVPGTGAGTVGEGTGRPLPSRIQTFSASSVAEAGFSGLNTVSTMGAVNEANMQGNEDWSDSSSDNAAGEGGNGLAEGDNDTNEVVIGKVSSNVNNVNNAFFANIIDKGVTSGGDNMGGNGSQPNMGMSNVSGSNQRRPQYANVGSSSIGAYVVNNVSGSNKNNNNNGNNGGGFGQMLKDGKMGTDILMDDIIDEMQVDKGDVSGNVTKGGDVDNNARVSKYGLTPMGPSNKDLDAIIANEDVTNNDTLVSEGPAAIPSVSSNVNANSMFGNKPNANANFGAMLGDVGVGNGLLMDDIVNDIDNGGNEDDEVLVGLTPGM